VGSRRKLLAQKLPVALEVATHNGYPHMLTARAQSVQVIEPGSAEGFGVVFWNLCGGQNCQGGRTWQTHGAHTGQLGQVLCLLGASAQGDEGTEAAFNHGRGCRQR